MIKSNRSELSRYYGNFRGVDFSSDHTLVSEKRFPYLVNMYKDYVSGGGQGIETIPGFRRRFSAPNKAKVNGIHSYKDKDSKRHVLVHAGTSLYDWKSFPNDAGISKEIVAVVKEYDEYTSDIEGVGIAGDYVKVEGRWAYPANQEFFLDIRAISGINSSRWVSIYPDAVFYNEPTNRVYLPNGYEFTHGEFTANNNRYHVEFSIVFPKVIVDDTGNEIARFSPGDTVNVFGVAIRTNASLSSYRPAMASNVSLADTGYTTTSGERILLLLAADTTSTSSYSTALWYGSNKNRLSLFKKESLPPGLKDTTPSSNFKQIALINASKYNRQYKPFEFYNNDYYRIYVLYDGDEPVGDINLANTRFYQYTVDGEKVFLPSDLSKGLDICVVFARTDTNSTTVIDIDEYEEQGKLDYVCVDASGSGEIPLVSVRKKSTAERITGYRIEGNVILFKKDVASVGEELMLTFSDEADVGAVSVHNEMSDRESKSFVFNNKLYIIDGEHYLVYEGKEVDGETVYSVSNAADNAYIPTTYINIVPGGENADNGEEYEQRNILSPYFKHTFIADGTTKDFYLNENMLDGIKEIKVYGEVVTDYTVDLANGKVSFNTAPPRSETVDMSEGVKYPELYAGVEITAIKGVYPAPGEEGETTSEEFKSMINSATLATIFDNRVFLSGFASAPNLILWSNLKNPSYIGILNYVRDGVGTTPITAMLPVANALLVLKGDTEQDGAVYYHTPHDTGIDVMPKTYPSEAGLAGIGCLGAACNFLDDPVFVSRLGLEGISQLKIASERSKEHRSSLIDAKLVNLDGLKDAKICEWGGYLVLLVDGKIFLADSRQVYQNDRGEIEYEWYYLEDIGIFDGQYKLEKYLTEWPRVFRDKDGNREPITITYEGKDYPIQLITDVFTEDAPTQATESVKTFTGEITLNKGYGEGEYKDKLAKYSFDYAIYPHNNDYVAVLCDGTGEQVGGTFCPAVTIKNIYDGVNGDQENIFFGTTNGVVCSFNFDKRNAEGVIPPEQYTFDERAIYSGCALKMDNCGVPHMTKTTVKKSTVIKVKSFQSTAAKLRVRTNDNPYNEIARINATRFDFDRLDFSDFSFVVGEDTLFSVREKEKKWVEKQYYIYSDEYKKPFSLYYAAFKYYVAGEFKKQAAAVVSTAPSRPTSSSSGGSSYVSKAPYIEGGYWYVNGINTFVKAEGIDGASPYIMDGYWYINGKNLGVKARGEDGKSVSIESITESTASGGSNVVKFSDGKTMTVNNGNDGKNGKDGAKGDPGDKGDKGDRGDKGDKGDRGDKGDPGEGFKISKTYPSISAMNAGFSTDGVPLNGFVLINTGNVSDEDNAKLFIKLSGGYSYLTDLSGSQGIQGDKGDRGDKGDQGEKGLPGNDGYTPVKYKDYFTPEEIADIVDHVIEEIPDGGITEEVDPTVPSWAKQPNKPTYTASEVGARPVTWTPSYTDVGADKAGTAQSLVGGHNTNTGAHNDIRLELQRLDGIIKDILDSEDPNLDEMHEVVAYIKSNAELIEAITIAKVNVADIINNLTTNVTNKPLSAAQGVALKALIDAITVPTKVSQLTNDNGYQTATQVNALIDQAIANLPRYNGEVEDV